MLTNTSIVTYLATPPHALFSPRNVDAREVVIVDARASNPLSHNVHQIV